MQQDDQLQSAAMIRTKSARRFALQDLQFFPIADIRNSVSGALAASTPTITGTSFLGGCLRMLRHQRLSLFSLQEMAIDCVLQITMQAVPMRNAPKYIWSAQSSSPWPSRALQVEQAVPLVPHQPSTTLEKRCVVMFVGEAWQHRKERCRDAAWRIAAGCWFQSCHHHGAPWLHAFINANASAFCNSAAFVRSVFCAGPWRVHWSVSGRPVGGARLNY